MEQKKKVLVIGAGASGLVTAKTLLRQGFDVTIVDSMDRVGGAFVSKAYEGARMVSSKYLTAFSDFRIARSGPIHLTLKEYVEYLEEYAEGLSCRFNTRVLRVRKVGDEFEATTKREDEAREAREIYWAVAVCTGLHTHPNIPKQFLHQNNVEVMHSGEYKDPKCFEGRRVVVVGCGETAFDVAWAAAHVAKSVTMIHRRGFVSIPAEFPAESMPPLDCVIANFGTHAWESEWAVRTGFHWFVTTKFQRLGMLLLGGSSFGWNQWCGKSDAMSWDEGRKHVVNKSVRCMALLNRGRKRSRLAQWLYARWDAQADHVPIGVDLKQGEVARVLGPDRLEFVDGSTLDADVVVLCTGYVQRFEFLENRTVLPSQHFIIDPEEPRLAFVGFVRPNVGAIPPLAEMQAMWWTLKLLDYPLRTISSPRQNSYKLVDRKLAYAVDYGYYVFALAREMGTMPNLLRWALKRPLVALAVAFGQAHVPIFRLDGPFADERAPDVCATELLVPIRQRPLPMNILFCFNLMFFATINALATALETIISLTF